MSIDGISLLEDSTGLAVSGGTALVFENDGVKVDNGIHVAENTSGVDFSDRRHCSLTSRNPALQPDGTFSKHKRTVKFTIPFTNAAGKTEYAVSRHTLEFPEEYSTAEINELRYMAAQWITDTELANFFWMGSLK